MNLYGSPSGYWIQPGQAPEAVLAELRDLGIKRPFEPFDGLDESMPAPSLRLAVQVGLEMLGKLAGFGTGDYLTADIANRGMLEYLKLREASREVAGLPAYDATPGRSPEQLRELASQLLTLANEREGWDAA